MALAASPGVLRNIPSRTPAAAHNGSASAASAVAAPEATPSPAAFLGIRQLQELLEKIHTDLTAVERSVGGVVAGYEHVSRATDQIREECADLIQTQEHLLEAADHLRTHLRFFE